VVVAYVGWIMFVKSPAATTISKRAFWDPVLNNLTLPGIKLASFTWGL